MKKLSGEAITAYRNCPVGNYHWFKVLLTTDSVQEEVCKFCHKKETYLFHPDGKMVDERKYYNDHIRAFAQPSQLVYYDINPNAEAKFALEAKQEKQAKERQGILTEKFRFAVKRALEDKDDGIKK